MLYLRYIKYLLSGSSIQKVPTLANLGSGGAHQHREVFGEGRVTITRN
jgi:hypothetical protein